MENKTTRVLYYVSGLHEWIDVAKQLKSSHNWEPVYWVAYPQLEELPVKESTTTLPKSYYGAAKLCAESYLNLYRNFGLETTAFRMFNVFGPNQNLENTNQGMLSIFLSFIFLGLVLSETMLIKKRYA